MRIRATRELANSFEVLTAWTESQAESFAQGTEEAEQQKTSQEHSSGAHVKGRTITHGNLQRGLWKVSWPILVTATCISIVDLVHVQCAGKLSSAAQAIIGVCDQFMMICVIFITSLSTAGTALISKAYGARNTQDVVVMIRQMLLVLSGLAAVMVGAVLLLSKPLLAAFSGCIDNCDTTIHEGELYLSVIAYYLLPSAIVACINAAFIGTGNARVQLITLTAMTIVDTLMNYLLFYLGWPLKDAGIRGIAAASICGYTVAALLAGVLWFRSDVRRSHLSKGSGETKSTQIIRPLLSTGVPSAIQEIAWCSSTFVLFWILSLLKHPSEIVAAWTIGQRLEAFATLPLSGFAMAALVAVGQNLGSGRVARAWKAGWSVAALAVGLLLLAGGGLFLLAEPLARVSTSDEATREILVGYLRIAAFGLPFLALDNVLSGSLQAMSDNKVPMMFSFFSNWIVGLSLTYFLAVTLGHGPNGAWLAAVISTAMLGIFIGCRFLTKSEWTGFSPFARKIVTADERVDIAASSGVDPPPPSRGKKAVEIELPTSDSG